VLQVSGGKLVGRAAEFGRLTRLLDQAVAGEPVVALVSGDAGMGKTRLVAEVAAAAAGQGFIVLSGRCAELGDSVPYLPLADALHSATSGQTVPALVDAIAARPVLGLLLPDRDAAEIAGGEVAGMAQQQLFGAVLGMLAELAGTAPVLLILEDMHWADRSTRDLLTFLSRVLHRERIAVIATYRTDDLHRGHPLRAVAAELVRLPSVTAVEVGPLGDEAMAEHLTALAQCLPEPHHPAQRSPEPHHPAQVPLEAASLETIIRRAEGNAYYAEELLAASTCGTDLPAGLADLLLARLQRLSPEGQRVVHAAAVAGRRVEDDLVRLACGLDEHEYEQAVREAVANQLLVPDGDQGYAFRHALLREAAYADLLPGERTRMHATLAELLADPVRLAVPGTAAELAHHSLASHDIPGGFSASVLAGKEAERLAAPAEAHQHFDQALALWDRVTDPEKLADMQRGWLAFKSATNASASGDLHRAEQQLRRLLSYVTVEDDPALCCRANERLAYYLLEQGAGEAAVAAARAGIDALPEDPPSPERARALATYAQTLLTADDLSPAHEWALRARDSARAAQAPWVEADALVTLGLLDERAGRPAAAVELFTVAYRKARDAGVLGVRLRAAFELARMHLESGDLDQASATAHEGLKRAEEAGLMLAPYGLDLQYLHYLAHFHDGDWDHAQHVADGFPVRVTTDREAVLSAMALFIDVARGNARVADRRTWLEPFWPTERFSAYLSHGLLAEHALWLGDTATALAEVAAAIKPQIERSGYGPQLIRVAAVGLAAQADLASHARLAGDAAAEQTAVEGARVLIETARRGAAYPRRPNWVLGADGRAWLARAEAEWLRAQGDNDPAAWRAVLETFGPAFVYEGARSRWRLAEALLEAGHRDEAQEEWRQAIEVAERLGARPLRKVLADLGRRGRLAREDEHGGRDPVSPVRGLTAREQEVLRLLAAGRSNREIAAELFIAPKTASVHVSNILGKLHAATRTEAAAIAHAEGIDL
jgi:DNA-binding CsgD family transcriptional regulator